ncbi:AAA family ATPase [Virgibacillus sp. MSP4-1]|uniref:AAA family ATPase n=1 Tax=Virgibacillus sp. MSP4-1 TaxID=2700081 RepID=UPI0003A19853|nr:AAA family ATPase [Virgibacillus sp. MSP4-1]QHS22501.1 AAA family ATPase [Virgibacillus sp. MSP4-1]
MINYFIISSNGPSTEAIKKLLYYDRKFAKSFRNREEFQSFISDDDYGVLFITSSSAYDFYDLCGDISLQMPNLKIILIAHEDEIDYKKAMYVGATDVIPLNFEEQEWKQALVKAESIIEIKLEEAEKKFDRNPARTITVASTKGGIGKTTISVNLAVAFAKQAVNVAIIDLDLQFGDVPLLLDLQPKQTIYEWLKESYENGDGKVNPYITYDPKTKVSVLAAPSSPEFAELITGEHISTILSQLQKEFDVIIVDTPPSFVETSLVAIENSEDILLITSLDLPALKNGKLAMDTFELLGLRDKVKILLNRDTKMEGMDQSSVEKIIGQNLELSIPSDYKTVISSINLGIPFVIRSPKTNVAKSIEKLVKRIDSNKDGNETRRKRKKKRFSFFRWRH